LPKAKGLLAKTDKTDAFFLAEFGKHFTPDPSPTKFPLFDDLQEMIHYKNNHC
jgi:hypothetical protein